MQICRHSKSRDFVVLLRTNLKTRSVFKRTNAACFSVSARPCRFIYREVACRFHLSKPKVSLRTKKIRKKEKGSQLRCKIRFPRYRLFCPNFRYRRLVHESDETHDSNNPAFPGDRLSCFYRSLQMNCRQLNHKNFSETNNILKNHIIGRCPTPKSPYPTQKQHLTAVR